MVVVKLIVIVLVLVSSAVGSDASVIQRLIVRLEDPPSHPSSDNCTLFKQIEVRVNFVDIFRNSGCLFVDDRNIQKVSSEALCMGERANEAICIFMSSPTAISHPTKYAREPIHEQIV